MRQRAVTGLVAATLLALAACGGDDDDDAASAGVTEPAATSAATPGSAGAAGTPGGDAVVAGAPFPADRCAANEAAGTITYLSGFDFAATASIVDVVVAEQAGYYDDVCLDVELKPSFSTSNYALIAGGEAEIASGGSFSEVVDYATANDVEIVAVDVEGRAAIDSLIIKPGGPATLEEVAGTTIGVKGKIPVSVAAMLAGAGLVEGTDYQTVLLDGFDPIAHYNLDGIVGFPGYKSNEPGQLERAGLPFTLFDPTEYDVPGSFGVLFTTREWAEANPAVLQDFLRATMRGLADALADPAAATQTAVDLVEANGNPSFLSLEGESYRWATDSELLQTQTPDGDYGVPDLTALQEELDAYAAVGLFGGTAPDAAQFALVDPIAGVYDEQNQVIWPS
ncbi:MAG TPA: ABC transporter substrate-binding protein [Ilumatobacteraceae bacterium]|nr:ABC transporter substrate-binding protein [Ilumatobacteraceae bacterium]